MSLENINAPQFVDFSSVETFDLYDGADFCFEKRVVGEDNKLLDDMFQKKQDKAVDTLINAMQNSTLLNKKSDPEIDPSKKGPIKAVHKTEENKENTHEPVKKSEIVGHSAHKVGSALDIVNSGIQDKTKKAKTPVKSIPKQRTLSHSSSTTSTSTTTTSTKIDKPLLPLYKGVKFIPKLGQKMAQTLSNDSYSTGGNSANNSVHTEKKAETSSQAHKPVLYATEKKPVGLTRSTPGKSASFKQQANVPKKTNIISNIIKTKTLTKTTSYSSDAEFNSTTTSLDSTHDSIKSNVSSLSGRKKSDSNKPVGLLHTELRAMKRTEYEQHQKERERMANLKKQDLEQEKMKKQQEEIQKLRLKTTFKSNPIKHFKPVEIKPSERTLTDPKSPLLAMNQSSDGAKHAQKHNSMVTVQTTITTTHTEYTIESH
ncbi:unnamed protein product [Brachionus calyciflorus]|uniref:TPX2 C-terminal domain-containing protein n=1 Tax=Brachionus calyciflorus TaxID=104777 RepID=A0A813M4C8_9BILA|nr:unnamed protein product [Brachionus calyciflorus]